MAMSWLAIPIIWVIISIVLVALLNVSKGDRRSDDR